MERVSATVLGMTYEDFLAADTGSIVGASVGGVKRLLRVRTVFGGNGAGTGRWGVLPAEVLKEIVAGDGEGMLVYIRCNVFTLRPYVNSVSINR